MSSMLRVPLRERWSARTMVLKKWLIRGGSFGHGDHICELEIDGVAQTFVAKQLHPQDRGGVYWHYVAEGNEVGPSGTLLEYSDSATVGREFALHESARRPLVRRREYPRFFLSYRREDAEPYAWRLHESMSASWGEVDVFMDQHSIQPGDVFPWTIQQAAAHAKAMIVLMGPKWLSLADAGGKRRLDDERDYVRREITAALDRGTLVVPILLPGATLPERSSLPRELEALLDVQFLELSHRHWRSATAQLKGHLEQYFKDVLKDHIS